MAAITIKFGVQSDMDEVDRELADAAPEPDEVADGLNGLGEADEADEVLEAALNQSHAALVNMVYLRRACEEELRGRSIHVTFEGNNVWLNLDRPLESVPAWNPPTGVVKRFRLLSWTSKMGTPSFSLPAGAGALGGACPGAAGGQSLVPLITRRKQLVEVERVLGMAIEPAAAICQRCYAEGGQYSTGQVQYAQLMRFAWTQQAVADGSFAQVMTWAVKNANYYLAGKGKVKTDEKDENGKAIKVPARGERRSGRLFFRLHDSGDFYSPEYIAAWKTVANACPEVTFWAPSRCWAVPKLRDAVDEINNPPGNLVIRPSAYTINSPHVPYLGPGWAAGSTVYGDKRKPPGGPRLGPDAPYQWDCQAYQTDTDKVTCRDARDVDGEVGCRACWLATDLAVNYTLHGPKSEAAAPSDEEV